MNAKHQFKYTYNETDLEEFSPLEVTFEVPGDATLTQMLYNFERYLQAAGFVFTGKLDFVDDTFDIIDEVDGALYEIDKQKEFEKLWDKVGCGSIGDSITPTEYKKQRLKEWNEGIAKLDNEQKQKCREEALKIADLHNEATKELSKNNWVHGICNPPSPDWKKNK